MIKLLSKSVADSTNNEAKRYVQEMHTRTGMTGEEFILVCGKQTDAKCRFDRQWLTPHQNIAMTIAVPRSKGFRSLLPLYAVTQHLIQRTLKDFIRNKDVLIKWPNDIYIEEKKISSTLVEYDLNTIYIGVNINLNLLGEDLGFPAIDIRKYNTNVSMKSIINRLQENITFYSSLFKNTDSMDLVKDKYNNVMHKIYQYVEISLDAGKLHTESGLCMGIDSNGKILLQNADGDINAWSVYDASISD